MKTIQELLMTGAGTEGQLLIPRKIYATLIAAVQKKLLPRELAAIRVGRMGIPGSSLDMDLEDADSMAVYKVAEGAGIPFKVQTYTSFNIKPDKYGVRPNITTEMIEDSKYPLLRRNIENAGIKMAENETSLIVNNALANGTNTVAGSGAATISNVTRAIQYLEDADYEATDIIMGPEFATDIRNIDSFIEADKWGSNEMQKNGFIGKIFGMNVYRVSGNIMTTTTAYVIDRKHAYMLVEKRPITVKNYDEVSKDLSGSIVTQRIAARQIRADAISIITT